MRIANSTLPLSLTLPVLLAFQGCTTASVRDHSTNRQVQQYERQQARTPARPDNFNYEKTLEVALLDQYQLWKGTPYRLGGLGRGGIDCSGFVYRTFKDGLGQKLPRTTTKQSYQGFRINKHDLQTGDLVFFKTPGNKQHVGIYMNNGLFMHASTSIGVTISRLDNQYWQNNYWQSRRIPL